MLKRLLTILFILAAVLVHAQKPVPVLEKEISLTLTNVTVGAALEKIANQVGFVFSYNPTLINAAKVISIKATNKSVREVLLMVLGETISYKANGMYVILSKAEAKKKVTVSGYVYDKSSGKKLANTTVYDPNTMTSSISNDYGYYEMAIPKKVERINLTASKSTYGDTVIKVATTQNQMVQIEIEPEVATTDTTKKNLFKEAGVKFVRGAKAFINNINVKDTLNRRFQLSFLPYIGTNHKLSGNVINRVSINVLGGYSMGTNGAEFGGIFNINRRDVSGFQAGGIFNTVGGSFNGFQAGGILNTVNGNFKGFQAGGVTNLTMGNVKGFQAGGVINVTKGRMDGFQAGGMFNVAMAGIKGFQAAGFMNINTDTARAFSAAGFANIATKAHYGVQAAGLFNYSTHHYNGAQIAGLFNSSLNLNKTAQIAGLFNFSARNSGTVQLAALFNYATNVTGLQLGILNISDTCSSGVSVGLLNITRKGVHQLEISADELLFGTVAFRTGSRGFHNIFSVGMSAKDTQSPLWAFGYGVGTSIKMSKRWNWDFDLTYNHISKGGFNTNVNFLNRLYFGPEVAVKRMFRIAFGPTVNLFLSDTTQTDYASTFASIAPYSFSDYTSAQNNVNIKWWVGGKVALRFF